MERTTIKGAKEIFGQNFIGIEEIKKISDKIDLFIPYRIKETIPEIPFDFTLLTKCKRDYILVLGIPYFKDGSCLNLLKMRNHFGWDPEISEPCFYNQDWYLKESFANSCTIELKWYLIRKELIVSTRGLDSETQKAVNSHALPSALVCAYIFFVYYFHSMQFLWDKDFVWCSDLDSSGDKIYVARYFDPIGKSKNGFSIHRYLRVKKNYGCIDLY